jgi:hypothetical protein
MYSCQYVVLFRMNLRPRSSRYDIGLPCTFTASALIYKVTRCDISENNLYSHLQNSIKYCTELFMATNRATRTEKRNVILSLKSVVIIWIMCLMSEVVNCYLLQILIFHVVYNTLFFSKFASTSFIAYIIFYLKDSKNFCAFRKRLV